MKKKESEIASFLLLAFVLCACNSVISKTTEAATSNPPISIPTIPSTMTYAASPAFQRQATATWYLKTATPVLLTPPHNDIGYFNGIIVITQYYMFLDHALYEEAYQLHSSSARERTGSSHL